MNIHFLQTSCLVLWKGNMGLVAEINAGCMHVNRIILCWLITISGVAPVYAQLTYAHLAPQFDKSWKCGRLQLIPIKYKDTVNGRGGLVTGNVISFEKAMREGKITVKETNVSGGDDVSLLEVKNRSKSSILVNSGEIVAGGMQDRAFGATIIIPPDRKKRYLPVFCIEKGRWGKKEKSSGFRYAGSVDAGLRKQIDVSKKQNRIWKEIDKMMVDNKVRSATRAYLDLFKDTAKIDTSCMTFFRTRMMESDSSYGGFVAITGDRIIDCQLFGSNSLCVASFETMVKGYLRSITQFDIHPDVSNDEVRAFLDKFMQTETQQQQYLAKHGRLYTRNGLPTHLIAYDD